MIFTPDKPFGKESINESNNSLTNTYKNESECDNVINLLNKKYKNLVENNIEKISDEKNSGILKNNFLKINEEKCIKINNEINYSTNYSAKKELEKNFASSFATPIINKMESNIKSPNNYNNIYNSHFKFSKSFVVKENTNEKIKINKKKPLKKINSKSKINVNKFINKLKNIKEQNKTIENKNEIFKQSRNLKNNLKNINLKKFHGEDIHFSDFNTYDHKEYKEITNNCFINDIENKNLGNSNFIPKKRIKETINRINITNNIYNKNILLNVSATYDPDLDSRNETSVDRSKSLKIRNIYKNNNLVSISPKKILKSSNLNEYNIKSNLDKDRFCLNNIRCVDDSNEIITNYENSYSNDFHNENSKFFLKFSF